MAVREKVILGVDPGTNIMGFGAIMQVSGKIKLLDFGIVRFNSEIASVGRLREIFESTLKLVELHKPDEFSIEAPFFGKNVQSMLKLGRAQGVSIAAALIREVPVFEYSPKKIKQSITGNGNASKEQVAGMLKSMLLLKEIPENLDATDGLAAAVCHAMQNGNPLSSSGKKSGWKKFLKENPGREI